MTTTSIDRTESELRAAARRRGLTMKELAALMDVSVGYLSQIANGKRPWTPKMREKAMAVLGEVPGQGTVYRQGGVVTGESSFIRERACTLGMTMHDLADRVGVSYSYMTQVARGRQNMGVKVQARVVTVQSWRGELLGTWVESTEQGAFDYVKREGWTMKWTFAPRAGRPCWRLLPSSRRSSPSCAATGEGVGGPSGYWRPVCRDAGQ